MSTGWDSLRRRHLNEEEKDWLCQLRGQSFPKGESKQRLWVRNRPVWWRHSSVAVFEEGYQDLRSREGISGARDGWFGVLWASVSTALHSEKWHHLKSLPQELLWGWAAQSTGRKCSPRKGPSQSIVQRNCGPRVRDSGVLPQMTEVTNRVNVTSKTRQSSCNHHEFPPRAKLWQGLFPRERGVVEWERSWVLIEESRNKN